MRNLLKCLSLLVALSSLSGCAVSNTSLLAVQATGIVQESSGPSEREQKRVRNKYSGSAATSEENTAVLKKLLGEQKVSFKPFISSEPGLKKISCRLATNIIPPRWLTYAGFVEESIVSQFKSADKYSTEAPLSLSGALTFVDFSAPSFGSGAWKMSLEVVASNGKKAVVNSNYPFDSAFGGIEACARVQEALFPAVEQLVSDLIQSPDFAAMVSQDGQAQAQGTRNDKVVNEID